MNALTQYIDLFRQNRAAIDAHSATVLNAARTAALALLEKVGRLPDRGDEGFEKTSVNDMFAPPMSPPRSVAASPISALFSASWSTTASPPPRRS